MQLFGPDAPWQAAAERIQVFQLYGEWVGNHPADSELQGVIEGLNSRGLAIAMETGALDAEGCGAGIEGFPSVSSSLSTIRSIRTAGGTLRFITLDEPYYFAHFYDGPNACKWSAETVAAKVDHFVQAARTIFPDVVVGESEPLAGPANAKEYQDWLDVFGRVNGYHLAYLHLDVDWSRPSWPDEVRLIQEHAKKSGVPVGIIYTGNAFDKTDQSYLEATGERVKKLEIQAGVQPDHVIFQSWDDKPDRVLPESDPSTYTGFIDQYFTDKASLGYPREGAGANLALGKAVRVSNQFEDFAGALAVDGDFGTLWNSGGGAIQWIEIDLGAAYNISEIRLTVSQYPNGPTVHEILGKGPNAGDPFNPLHKFDGNTNDGAVLVFKPDSLIKQVRYIRVTTTVSPSWVSWREIEIINAEN
jgi:F5/8 type C domain-containing protein